MTENIVELLFFDTFAHDNTEEINLDLVQFPKPVYVTEVRIIPLGARVQADFPGGVRLGATNPSQFQIEFFVNDLGKPGASTFETLGAFEYDQNGKINLECTPDDSVRKIPTDGLVLKGLYTTITLAVYGTLTNNIAEQLVQPVVNPALPNPPNTIADAQQIISGSSVDAEWSQDNISTQPLEYPNQAATNYQQYNQPESYQHQEFSEYYNDVPKDPRSYHHTPETEWDKGRNRDSDRERNRDMYQDRDHERRDRRYSRSESRDRDRPIKDYHEVARERDGYDREHERTDYRTERDRIDHEWQESERDRDRTHDRERTRDRRHDDGYRRSERYRDDREERKRPRTPPMQMSPKKPHSPPHIEQSKDILSPNGHTDINVREEEIIKKDENVQEEIDNSKEVKSPINEEITHMDVEEFEPILSDEDIVDDGEHYQDSDYDYSAYTNNDDIIRLFIPGVTELKKYSKSKKYVIRDNSIELEEGLKTIIGIADDYLKSSITKYVLDNFNKHNTEIKEEFVHLCEKLICTIGEPPIFVDIMKVHNVVRSLITPKMSVEDRELANQTNFIIETITDWLKISLNYDMANAQDQPAYKIRHIKCGVRLADWLCHSEEYIQYIWNKNYNLHRELLDLYRQEFMALSIKLMILKALDTYLLHKFAIEKFLISNSVSNSVQNGYTDTVLPNQSNGYKIIIEALDKNPLVRIKFALSSILKKLNLYEVLFKIYNILIKLRNVSHDISAEEINLITKSLNQILSYCNSGPFTMSQPKRFLPVSAQFEIMRADSRNVLVHYFGMFNLLQCFLLLLTYPSTLNLPPIKTPIFEIVSALLDNTEGLQYLSENSSTVNVLLKCLLRTDEEMQYSLSDCIEVKSHNLGLRIAYKLQCLYHIECLLDSAKSNSFDIDAFDIIDQLHGLFCLTFSPVGKISVSEMLGMNENARCLLQFFDNVPKSESYLQKLKKSSGTGYVLDLLYYTIVVVPNIKFLEKNTKTINYILNLIYDDQYAFKINEIRLHLTPLEQAVSLNYDNISTFVEIMEKQMENVISHPGPLITALRIVQYLGISNYQNKDIILLENPLTNYVELKYKHVILQLYSLDGTIVLVKILQKICNHYEQPGLHSSILASNHGLLLVSVIYPCIVLLKQMLAYVVQCRNTNFRDLTTIPVLLQTYNFLNSYPITAIGAELANKSQIAIIDTLLVYTQPLSDEIHEKDSLNKTLWSQMCGEVIKFITTAPYTFVSGLLILSELLPLPLPIQTRDELTKSEITWAINLRKLWSAHLYPYNNAIQEMVNRICISTQPQLLNLLRRICVQISDLAANSALIIARGMLDAVYKALLTKDDGPCTSHVARLLNFLACLVTHNTVKCAVLHLMHTNSNVTGNQENKYSSLILAFSNILKRSDVTSTSHIQAQECILSILQSFCDVEITLMQNPIEGTLAINSETYLANAMPIKEHLLTFIDMILDHLTSDNSYVTYLPIVRTLLLLTEHNYGFYHLRERLLKREKLFLTVLNKLSQNFSKTSAECLSTLNTLVEFLRVCLITEENDATLLYSSRTIKLTVQEVKNLMGWEDASVDGEGNNHPFLQLEEKETEENTSFETILEGLSLFLKQLQTLDQESENEIPQEVLLPPPESLLTQYASRIICSSSDACDERLTDRYWLTIPADEGEGELETVPCDLFEICRQLPPEFNLIKEVEKLCRISRTETPNTDVTNKQNEEQRAKTRKPFITPMRPRGFPRTTPQRPDLFRSRPPNTSRPPSLHVDDFVALETCGAQPTGPTVILLGYNKISREILASTRMARGSRGRAFVTSERSMQYNRQIPWWGAPLTRNPYF
ncbi:protein virilizer-like isoform X2 [Rhynchophorus ferrugineus]|uniref:protein virilizer-like isoform X2 n=1 Tax=Rhynchophorus ferrugineus TaxID=354439 RepID=UPI003FCD4F97